MRRRRLSPLQHAHAIGGDACGGRGQGVAARGTLHQGRLARITSRARRCPRAGRRRRLRSGRAGAPATGRARRCGVSGFRAVQNAGGAHAPAAARPRGAARRAPAAPALLRGGGARRGARHAHAAEGGLRRERHVGRSGCQRWSAARVCPPGHARAHCTAAPAAWIDWPGHFSQVPANASLTADFESAGRYR